jgi:aminoglycoside phosphotransferase (APT) family kinase protein
MQEDILRDWIETVARVRVTSILRLEGGGSREAWRVDAVDSDGAPRPLFLRRDLGVGPVSGTEFTLAREAALCRELAERGIPVSQVIAFDESLDVVLAERAVGEGAAAFGALVRSPHRADIIADFINILGRVHNIAPDTLALPGFERPNTPEDHALIEVRRWRRFYEEKAPAPDPVLSAAYTWLERNPPRHVDRTVLVHGDCGPGNFMFEGDHVTCVVDWEFAHFGDPMDDIAWLGFRQHMSSGLAFEDMDASLRQWEQVAGLRLDRARISYYGLLVLARCATCCVRGLANAGATIDNAVWHELSAQLRRAMAYLLADLNDVTPDPTPTFEPVPGQETSRIVNTLSRDLEGTLAPDLTSPDAIKRARGSRMLLNYLKSAVVLDPVIEEAERRDSSATFGRAYRHSGDAVNDLADWIEQAGPGDPNVLRYLCRRADRQFEAWRQSDVARGRGELYPALYRRA